MSRNTQIAIDEAALAAVQPLAPASRAAGYHDPSGVMR